MKLERPLVALDLETTGPNPYRDRVVQIGVVKVFPDGHEKEWETLVNPMCHIPDEVAKIHGITDNMVSEEPPFEVVAQGFQQAVRGADICGYNVMFDIRFLKAEYKRLGRGFEYGKVVDAFKIYMKHERRTLSAAVEYFLGEKHEGAHTALADAKASLRVLRAQLKRYPGLPQTVDELHDLLWNTVEEGYLDAEKKIFLRNGIPHLNFGKDSVRGLPLKEVPRDYLQWILRNDFSDRVKEAVKEALNEHQA